MKRLQRLLALALSLLLLSYAALPACAAAVPSEKEEAIYVMTDACGAVTDLEAVNIFAGGDITDYGDYSAVKLLNTTDAIVQNGDQITISSDADKVYYQGTMKAAEIPWVISIRYFLNGREYAPADVAGKDGALEIRFSIRKNERCGGSFYEDYALQAAFTLDAARCRSIVAEGATAANVGSDKQLSYTILPGKGVDALIKAEVTDFEMEPVTINALKLNLNVEVDDAELMEKVSELMDATKKLDSGADTLYGGTDSLKSGSGALLDGTAELSGGAGALDEGIAALQSGVGDMQAGLDALYERSDDLTSGSTRIKKALLQLQESLDGVSLSAEELAQLTKSSAAIKQGVGDLSGGAGELKRSMGYARYKAAMRENGLDVEALRDGNDAAISALSGEITDLKGTLAQIQEIPGYEAQAEQLREQIASLQSTVTLLRGNNAAIGGTESYLDALSGAAAELCDGASELYEKYEEFDAGISALADTLGEMLEKLAALRDGVDTLVEKYRELDQGIDDYTDGVSEIASSYRQIVDGVSSLAAGSKELLDGASSLSSGAAELYSGVISLCDGASELADGTGALYANTSGMDAQVQEQIDGILSSIGGEETETVSFVSEKNSNVTSVQFAIKTAAIEKVEAEEAEATPQKALTFWQKLLRLFGLY